MTSRASSPSSGGRRSARASSSDPRTAIILSSVGRKSFASTRATSSPSAWRPRRHATTESRRRGGVTRIRRAACDSDLLPFVPREVAWDRRGAGTSRRGAGACGRGNHALAGASAALIRPAAAVPPEFAQPLRRPSPRRAGNCRGPEAVCIAAEAVALGERAELRAPHDRRADIDVGGSEAIAAHVIAQRKELVENREALVEIAVAEHPSCSGGDLPTHCLI